MDHIDWMVNKPESGPVIISDDGPVINNRGVFDDDGVLLDHNRFGNFPASRIYFDGFRCTLLSVAAILDRRGFTHAVFGHDHRLLHLAVRCVMNRFLGAVRFGDNLGVNASGGSDVLGMLAIGFLFDFFPYLPRSGDLFLRIAHLFCVQRWLWSWHFLLCDRAGAVVPGPVDVVGLAV